MFFGWERSDSSSVWVHGLKKYYIYSVLSAPVATGIPMSRFFSAESDPPSTWANWRQNNSEIFTDVTFTHNSRVKVKILIFRRATAVPAVGLSSDFFRLGGASAKFYKIHKLFDSAVTKRRKHYISSVFWCIEKRELKIIEDLPDSGISEIAKSACGSCPDAISVLHDSNMSAKNAL